MSEEQDKEIEGGPEVICKGGKAGQGDLFPRVVHNATDHPVRVNDVNEFEDLCRQQNLDHGLLHRVGKRRKKKDHPHVRRFKYDSEKGEVVEIE